MNRAYEIKIIREAQKQLGALPKPAQDVVKDAIWSLAEVPRPACCKKLKGQVSLWRIRISNYRVVYEIKDDCLVVFVIRIGHRKDIYRDF